MAGPHADLARPIKDGSCFLFSDRQVDESVPIFDRENWGHKVYYDATEMLLNRWLISWVCSPRGKVCVISVCGCVFPLVLFQVTS